MAFKSTPGDGEGPHQAAINISKMNVNRAMFEYNPEALIVSVTRFLELSNLSVPEELISLIPVRDDQDNSNNDL